MLSTFIIYKFIYKFYIVLFIVNFVNAKFILFTTNTSLIMYTRSFSSVYPDRRSGGAVSHRIRPVRITQPWSTLEVPDAYSVSLLMKGWTNIHGRKWELILEPLRSILLTFESLTHPHPWVVWTVVDTHLCTLTSVKRIFVV